jgi:hypothetical protein
VSFLTIVTNDLGCTGIGGPMESQNTIKIGVGVDPNAVNWSQLV